MLWPAASCSKHEHAQDLTSFTFNFTVIHSSYCRCLNLIHSRVWNPQFSSPRWLQKSAYSHPLTHILIKSEFLLLACIFFSLQFVSLYAGSKQIWCFPETICTKQQTLLMTYSQAQHRRWLFVLPRSYKQKKKSFCSSVILHLVDNRRQTFRIWLLKL